MPSISSICNLQRIELLTTEQYADSLASATKAQAQYTYPVIPFLRSGSRQFWLSMALEFQFLRGMYELANVSFLIFEGEAYDDRKSALIRAEWDCNQQHTRVLHAQPHWHVYPSHLNRELGGMRAEFDEKSEAQAFVPEVNKVDSNNERDTEWDKGERFHFAMAARWASEGKDSHIAEISDAALLRWLDGCLGYTRSQFEFLYR